MEGLGNVIPGHMYSTEKEDIICYGYDASGLDVTPKAVVWPNSTEDISKIFKFAYENNYKVIPRGAGTGMTGGSIPTSDAILLSLEKMNRVLELDTENLNVIVEPGVINSQLQNMLQERGYFYPPDPASLNICTIGGNVAENAGGPRAVKYGVTRDYVMQLEAVLPDGKVITTGVKTAKSVVGYDLTRLLVGSEGTLATITKVRLKVLPTPESLITLLAFFDSLEMAGKTVSKIIASGIIPRTLEIMDRYTIDAVNRYKNVGIEQNIGALLLIELDGNKKTIYQQADKVSEICSNLNGKIRIAEDSASRQLLWDVRRASSPALYNISPGKISEDTVVPISRISDVLIGIERLSKKYKIPIACFGHAGDGNLHINILTDKKDSGKKDAKIDALIKEIFELTLKLEGSISGEHGIGLLKAKYITMELDANVINLMRGIKKVFDPKNILNPGKIFPS
ncbi:glycolate oxidase subunit GlcD [Candidatus Magnetoovum chiemensis]|nr:glycolate oxidase subunit GlcD [Candidatus Magnetoovum chiemensis]